MNLKWPCLKNGELGGFLMFVCNLNMTRDASIKLADNAKLQYLHNLLCVESLRHFDTLCVQVVIMTM